MADGSAIGLIHPRAAVKITDVEGSTVSVEVVEPSATSDAAGLATQVERALELLPRQERGVQVDADLLRSSDDPAQLLGWQLVLSAEQCQRYLADGDAGSRMAVLIDALEDAPASDPARAGAE
jgi:hypothetical protein